MQPLNVVYLHSHDTGRYVSPYGYAVDTPHIQRFAEQGVTFRQAFCANPTCSPSRASLMTGSWPHRNGMFGLTHRGFALNDYRQTWLHMLKEQGYHTRIAGIEHYGVRDPEVVKAGLGFEADMRSDRGYGEDFVDQACRFLETPHDRPFFLDVGFLETHRRDTESSDVQWHNGNLSPMGDARYVKPPDPLPDTPETRADFADFAVNVNRLDRFYGRILDTLDQAGLANQTLVIITTDHGIAFPRMKCSLTDDGIGVALMMRGPEATTFSGGKVVDAMVSHTDVYPTLCELLDVPVPSHVDGRSMLPLLDGRLDPAKPCSLHDVIHAQVNYHAAYEPKRCLRTQRYKYIKRFHDTPVPVLPNVDESISKRVWCQSGWKEQAGPPEELYDLLLDPNEANNLVQSQADHPMITAMRNQLDDWMKTHEDPIAQGPIPFPSSGKINRHRDGSYWVPAVGSDVFDPCHP